MGLKKRLKSLEEKLGYWYDVLDYKHRQVEPDGDIKTLHQKIDKLAMKLGYEFKWQEQGFKVIQKNKKQNKPK